MQIWHLGRLQQEGEANFGMDVVNFIKKDFYVDDVSMPQEAVSLIKRSIALLKGNGLVLHKSLSNSKEVLQQIPPKARAKGFTNIDIHKDSLPIKRTVYSMVC